MEIHVKIFDRKLSLKVQASDTIQNVKEKILEAEKIPVERQRLIFAGRHSF